MVETAWSGAPSDIQDILKRVETTSMSFNETDFGHFRSRKKKLLRRLVGIQRVQSRIDSAGLTLLEEELQREYAETLRQEEIHWFQKSQDKWLGLGDKNTKYFHTQTLIRRQRNRILGLVIDGQWTTVNEILQTHAANHFK